MINSGLFSPEQITEDMLKNSEYTIDNYHFKLKDGEYDKTGTGMAYRDVMYVGFNKCMIDKNGIESIVLLYYNWETSSSLPELYYVTITNKKLIVKGPIDLGDNTEVNYINFDNSIITLDLTVLNQTDSHSEPSEKYHITLTKNDFETMKELPPYYTKYINMVKNGVLKLDESVTIGNLLDNYSYLKNKKWDFLETPEKRRIVKFTGSVIFPNLNDNVKWMDGEYTVQFTINVDDDSFKLYYSGCKVKGELYNEVRALGGLRIIKKNIDLDVKDYSFRTITLYDYWDGDKIPLLRNIYNNKQLLDIEPPKLY